MKRTELIDQLQKFTDDLEIVIKAAADDQEFSIISVTVSDKKLIIFIKSKEEDEEDEEDV